MTEWAIRVENLGKKYLIRHQSQHQTLRHALTDGLRNWRRRLRQRRTPMTREEFWALQDLSFVINQGDRVGVIGRNGAGKSTLLKILSRITAPTAGRIRLRGRVASLLEVGTGFHPELTGRENIFLNGSILGMERDEIVRKFDAIVDFAEIERFLDTPVKRYSSGMYVRLAFAIAAHLEPEILVVDEVLAVGDVRFQRKCLGKMKTVGQDGRTVLFVSHQMGMISQLCNQAIFLESGKIVTQGETQTVIKTYLNSVSEQETNEFQATQKVQHDLQIILARTVGMTGQPKTQFLDHEAITLICNLKVYRWVEGFVVRFVLKDLQGQNIFSTERLLPEECSRTEQIQASIKIPGNFLTPGNYQFGLKTHIPYVCYIENFDEVCSFSVTDTGSEFSMYNDYEPGCVVANCEWEVGNMDADYQTKVASYRLV